MSAPYTHADHARKCAVATYRGEALGMKVQYVQARIGRTQCCAKIVTAWDTAEGREMWQLDLMGPIHGRMSAPTHNVRQCQGLDGRCTCAPVDLAQTKRAADEESAALGGGARSAPDGNHGETPSETAQ